MPLSANPLKWSNTLKQFVGNLPKNFLNVFDHFEWLAFKGLCYESHSNGSKKLFFVFQENFDYPQTILLWTLSSAKLTFPISCFFVLFYLINLVLELGIQFYFVLIFNENRVQDCISKIYFKKHGYTIGERFVSHGVSIGPLRSLMRFFVFMKRNGYKTFP